MVVDDWLNKLRCFVAEWQRAATYWRHPSERKDTTHLHHFCRHKWIREPEGVASEDATADVVPSVIACLVGGSPNWLELLDASAPCLSWRIERMTASIRSGPICILVSMRSKSRSIPPIVAARPLHLCCIKFISSFDRKSVSRDLVPSKCFTISWRCSLISRYTAELPFTVSTSSLTTREFSSVKTRLVWSLSPKKHNERQS